MLPDWLKEFTGSVPDPAHAQIGAAFTAAGAVGITLTKTTANNEAPWTLLFRADLRKRQLSTPEELLDAPAPKELNDPQILKAVPDYCHSNCIVRLCVTITRACGCLNWQL